MNRLLQRIERILFGTTAEERVALLNALIDQRADQRAVQQRAAALDRLNAEEQQQGQSDGQQDGWYALPTGQPIAEADLPATVRAFAKRVSAAYDQAQDAKQPGPDLEEEQPPR